MFIYWISHFVEVLLNISTVYFASYKPNINISFPPFSCATCASVSKYFYTTCTVLLSLYLQVSHILLPSFELYFTFSAFTWTLFCFFSVNMYIFYYIHVSGGSYTSEHSTIHLIFLFFVLSFGLYCCRRTTVICCIDVGFAFFPFHFFCAETNCNKTKSQNKWQNNNPFFCWTITYWTQT